MLYIFIALGLLMLVNISLFFLSKSEDPTEKKKEDSNKEETSERITYLKDYEPYWEN